MIHNHLNHDGLVTPTSRTYNLPEAAMTDRHSYVAPGPYSPDNPWGRVPRSGTLLCRFWELNDALVEEFRMALQAAVAEVEGLTYIYRDGHLPAIQWEADELGAYVVGSGLQHEPLRREGTMSSFVWLQYNCDREQDLDERPFDIRMAPGPCSRDVYYWADLIIAAAGAHLRSLQARQFVAA